SFLWGFRRRTGDDPSYIRILPLMPFSNVCLFALSLHPESNLLLTLLPPGRFFLAFLRRLVPHILSLP
ncbi:MAG: hypothetical protein AAB070_04640, partial [Candidatus Binatota bacterium]